MRRRTVGRVISATVVAAGAAVGLEAALVAAARHQWDAVLAPGPARVDEVVGALLALGAVLVTAWLGLTTLAAVLAHLPGRVGRGLHRWARAWSPTVARRTATVLVGASLAGVFAPGSAVGAPPAGPGFAVTAPAALGAPDSDGRPGSAAVASGDRSGTPRPPGFTPTRQLGTTEATRSTHIDQSALDADAPAPGWVPARPLERPQPSPALVTGAARRAPAGGVVVLRGDSLWSLVARHLGPGATDAEVAREWPRWYAANRAVIGDDPDLVLPGQVLAVPSPEAVAR